MTGRKTKKNTSRNHVKRIAVEIMIKIEGDEHKEEEKEYQSKEENE
jgi:hypothetical protein